MSRDEVFASKQDVAPFEFNQRVVDVFPDMIARSVPGYSQVIEGIAVLAREYVQPDTRVYDLGASLGAASLAVRGAISDPSVEIVAVDNSQAMVERLRLIVERDTGRVPVHCQLGDLRTLQMGRASMVILNYTLQFLPPADRAPVIAAIHEALCPGGALILSEKLRFADPTEQDRMTRLHLEFKRAHGYSELEIAQKRSALENVLIPDTEQDHRERLRQAGFASVDMWSHCLNFASFLAIRG